MKNKKESLSTQLIAQHKAKTIHFTRKHNNYENNSTDENNVRHKQKQSNCVFFTEIKNNFAGGMKPTHDETLLHLINTTLNLLYD